MNMQLYFLTLLLSSMTAAAAAWTPSSSNHPNTQLQSIQLQKFSRREWMTRIVVAVGTAAATTNLPYTQASCWAFDTQSALEELESSIEKMKPIPDLLEEKEWDKVRSILKVPPVNKLWNLGDSQNTLLQLARETGNIDLFELKDDLAYNLQLCDQLTYDNSFVYFQPGNGKVNIKEPQQLARKAMSQIQQAIDMTKEG